MKFLSIILLSLMATFVTGQDITMYETHTLTPKEGHEQDLDREIAEHNKLYHADPESAFMNYMFSISTGPRQGDILFAMGSCTFAQLGDRPGNEAHDKDWATVVMHSEDGVENVEYWIRNDDLTYIPANSSDAPSPVSVVRYFDVADYSDFIEVQAQIKSAMEKMGYSNAHVMYRNRFANKDGRDWAAVTSYKTWADLDLNQFDDFKKTFIELYGSAGWDNFDEKYGETVNSREDEMRTRRLDLQGDYKK